MSVIVKQEQLLDVLAVARKRGHIGIDTEFVWERTYYPELALIQVSVADDACCIIDVPVIGDLSALGDVIADPSIIKILHDSQQDLTILRRATGAYPKSVFDTQLVAGFADLTASTSLSGLVGDLLGVKLDKSETRTNWLQRPLTEKQEAYALDDVRYLPEIRAKLLAKLNPATTQKFVEEEMRFLDDSARYEEKDPELQFHRIKGCGRLSVQELPVLRELAAWRERQAVTANKPASWIIPDKTLLQLAREQPETADALRQLETSHRHDLNRHQKAILEAIETGLKETENPQQSSRHEPGHHRRLSKQANEVLEKLRRHASRLRIDVTLIATRADVEKLLLGGFEAFSENHRIHCQWRKKLIMPLLASFNPI